MGCCCGTDDVDEEREIMEQAQGQYGTFEQSANVALENDNVLNEQLPTVYYVIVGLGPIAVVNHRTLRDSQWGRDRIGDHPVLHVGYPNPWPKYFQHGLGQPNHLLSFPAFHHQPSVGGDTINGGLDSQHFGRQISAEFNTLEKTVTHEWVAVIQSRADGGAMDYRIETEIGGGAVSIMVAQRIADPWPPFPDGEAPYRLCLFTPLHGGRARLVYAAAIDLCTGPGRPSVDEPAGGGGEQTRDARTPPWLCPEIWSQIPRWINRRTFNGVDAIRDEVLWPDGRRVCVTAGGGVGLNAAEKGITYHCPLDWFGRSGLMPIFNNPRNITYLRNRITGERCVYGERTDPGVGITDENHLIADYNRHRMGRGAILHSVAATEHGVQVRLTRYPEVNVHLIRDWWGNSTNLDQDEGLWPFSEQYTAAVQGQGVAQSREYRRLVIPNGQDTEQVGQPHAIAGHLGFHAVEAAGRLVALATDDGLVRVLGAACNNYPGFDQETWRNAGRPAAGSPANVMWHFHTTLPKSAVPDGFIICGVNTALANQYFTDARPNTNVNTMTQAELTDVVGAERAARLIQARYGRNGYATLTQLRTAAASEDPSLANLTFAYPAIE